MTNVCVDGLVALVEGVRGYFAKIGATEIVVDFGLKARSKSINQGTGGANRVVLIPGKVDPSAGIPKALDAGAFTQPRHHSDNPRELVWFHKIVSVSVWGVDATDAATLQDPLKQYAATIALLEKTYQALHYAEYTTPDNVTHTAGLADLILKDGKWVAPPVENAFGVEFLATFEHNAPLFDRVLGTATPQPAIIPELHS